MHKTALLASSALVSMFIAQGALAAEWTGFYIGAHVGGAWGDVDQTNVTNGTLWLDYSPGDQTNFSPDGVLGGAQLGYNFQMTNWLFGIELSGAGLDFDETQLSEFGADDDVLTVEAEWLATAAARLGFLWGPESLIYIKGGYAGAAIQTSALDTSGGNQGSFATDETHHGWVGGVGVEHMISNDVSFGVEYNYIDLGSEDHSATPIVNNIEAQLHMVTARLNWHFNPL